MSTIYRLYTQYEFNSAGRDVWQPTAILGSDMETSSRDAAIEYAEHYDADEDTIAVRLVALDSDTGDMIDCVEGAGVDFTDIPSITPPTSGWGL